MEVYSIDESFLYWSADLPWREIGEQLLTTVRDWTGLPVGVGFGATKTLAKLANHLAKRGRGATGIHVLADEAGTDDALKQAELMKVWGISSGYCRRLAKLGITTPAQLRDADPHLIRRHLGVVGQRIVYELRGISCIGLETEVPAKQNICCSRSFGEVTNNLANMNEAVATFTAQAAMKMRRQDLTTSRIGVFIQTDRHAPVVQYAASWAVRLSAATQDTRDLCKAAAWCLDKIYRPEHCYKKAGVMLFELGARIGSQYGLFTTQSPERSLRLMRAMDDINKRFGRGSIRIASTSPFTLNPCRTWHLRSEHRSPRYTTRWEELPTVNAGNLGG